VTRRLFLLTQVLVAGCWRLPPERVPSLVASRLLALMNRRLGYMHDVARAKWNTKSAAEDRAREASLLKAMAEAGKAHGLPPASTTAFFAAQIEAAKILQRACFREWEEERRGPFADAPDLVRDLRPKIDAVGRELLPALATFQSGVAVPESELQRLSRQFLNGPGISEEVRQAATEPLRSSG
jgi:chorismate mutase